MELKAKSVDDVYLEYFNTGKHDLAQVYLKSEADKVIAEKDKDIQRLENLCESYRIDCDNLAIREANACKEIERDNKQIRHQKYKRCLAMEKLCRMHDEFTQLESERLGLPQRTLFLEYRRKAMWWNKWRKRWLELAEKFKEAK